MQDFPDILAIPLHPKWCITHWDLYLCIYHFCREILTMLMFHWSLKTTALEVGLPTTWKHFQDHNESSNSLSDLWSQKEMDALTNLDDKCTEFSSIVSHAVLGPREYCCTSFFHYGANGDTRWTYHIRQPFAHNGLAYCAEGCIQSGCSQTKSGESKSSHIPHQTLHKQHLTWSSGPSNHIKSHKVLCTDFTLLLWYLCLTSKTNKFLTYNEASHQQCHM